MKSILLILLAAPLMADGPKYSHSDAKIDDEFRQVYHDIRNTLTGDVRISSITVSTLTVTDRFSSQALSNWISYTPTFTSGWGTTSNVAVWYRRVGDTLEVKGTFQMGTVTADQGEILLPSGLTIDSSKTTGSRREYAGIIFNLSGAATSVYAGDRVGYLIYDGTNTDRVAMGYQTSAGAFNSTNVSAFFPNSAWATFNFRVPISGWGI